jgi:hypothetical protein
MRRKSRVSVSMVRNAISEIGAPWMPRTAVTITSLPSQGESVMPSVPVPSEYTHFRRGVSLKKSCFACGPKHMMMSAQAACFSASSRVPQVLIVSSGWRGARYFS